MMYRTFYNYNSFPMMSDFGFMGAFLGFLLIPFIVWSIAWKGWALWKAARNGSMPWFIALLVINTMGILEILYIFIFSKSKSEKTPKTTSKKRK